MLWDRLPNAIGSLFQIKKLSMSNHTSITVLRSLFSTNCFSILYVYSVDYLVRYNVFI